ncbi:MAG: ABC transporter permease [Lachnospiraceae bacterium]|jgi:ABC-2 type transport system permease protein|nr:ABC transporter permease [Lachnospiraceae bacterium]
MMGFKAIFKKQMKVFAQSPEVLIQFAIFPFLAFIITVLIDFEAMGAGMEELPGMSVELAVMISEMMAGNMPNMVTMQATLFAGMALIPAVAGFIAEDIEKKRLRFLMMAGVKPASYLLGVGIAVAIIAFVSTVAFAFIGEFSGVDFWIFTGAMMSGVAGSIMLGATIGILTKNQQAATALAMPAALVFGFLPMIAQFADGLARWLHPLYTQQLNVVADRLNGISVDTQLWQSFAIMWVNVLVLGILFAVVYRAKGVRDL